MTHLSDKAASPMDAASADAPQEARLDAMLREVAAHIEAGDEFSDGHWHRTGPVTGLGGGIWFGRWRRAAFVRGVEISRDVIADELRRLADWHWSPDA